MGWTFVDISDVCFSTMFPFSFAGVYLPSFLWFLQECASWSCGIFGVFFSLFLCLVPHYSHFIDISSHAERKRSYIWSEIKIICIDACFISNPATPWKEAMLFLTSRGQHCLKDSVFLGDLCSPSHTGSAGTEGPFLSWFNRSGSQTHRSMAMKPDAMLCKCYVWDLE